MRCSDCGRYKTAACLNNPMAKDWSDAEYLSCFLPKEEAAPAQLYSSQPYVARENRYTFENSSGQGSSAIIPPEIQGWNWGAFFFGWLWGICNNVWIALLEFIPYVGIVMCIVLGVKGNKWAWQKKRWDSIEHFQRTQRTWAHWALAIFLVGVFLFLIMVVAIVAEG
jgi:hypothetical protein